MSHAWAAVHSEAFSLSSQLFDVPSRLSTPSRGLSQSFPPGTGGVQGHKTITGPWKFAEALPPTATKSAPQVFSGGLRGFGSFSDQGECKVQDLITKLHELGHHSWLTRLQQ